jgi:hypothetical protein
VDYLTLIQQKSFSLLGKEYKDILQLLDLQAKKEEELEEGFKRLNSSNHRVYKERKCEWLIKRFWKFLACIPVIGFNSGSYDLNVMKGPLLHFLSKDMDINFTIKRGSRLQCIQTEKFRFLDMMNYLTPGTSYAKYLQTFEATSQKGFFPYDYINSLDRLSETSLPPHEAFENYLTRKNISEEEYQHCRQVWDREKMSTMRDFLEWYNNLDVSPFLEAIEKQVSIYQRKRIDMFKDAVSIPGIAVEWMFHVSDSKKFDIPLINRQNEDLYKTLRANIVGGPSIIFCRYQEKDTTRIREHEYGQQGKLCKEVLGCDANAFY